MKHEFIKQFCREHPRLRSSFLLFLLFLMSCGSDRPPPNTYANPLPNPGKPTLTPETIISNLHGLETYQSDGHTFLRLVNGELDLPNFPITVRNETNYPLVKGVNPNAFAHWAQAQKLERNTIFTFSNNPRHSQYSYRLNQETGAHEIRTRILPYPIDATPEEREEWRHIHQVAAQCVVTTFAPHAIRHFEEDAMSNTTAEKISDAVTNCLKNSWDQNGIEPFFDLNIPESDQMAWHNPPFPATIPAFTSFAGTFPGKTARHFPQGPFAIF